MFLVLPPQRPRFASAELARFPAGLDVVLQERGNPRPGSPEREREPPGLEAGFPDRDFRLAFTSGVSANSVCFERELLDHFRRHGLPAQGI